MPSTITYCSLTITTHWPLITIPDVCHAVAGGPDEWFHGCQGSDRHLHQTQMLAPTCPIPGIPAQEQMWVLVHWWSSHTMGKKHENMLEVGHLPCRPLPLILVLLFAALDDQKPGNMLTVQNLTDVVGHIRGLLVQTLYLPGYPHPPSHTESTVLQHQPWLPQPQSQLQQHVKLASFLIARNLLLMVFLFIHAVPKKT